MRVLVTGASGYIGRHVVTELLNLGHDVIAIDIREDGIDKRAIYKKMDIFAADSDKFNKLGKPELCVHMAWKDGFSHNSVEHMKNVSNHYLFLRELIDNGCLNIAVMGTMHEIGFWEGVIDENTPCNPLSLYGIAKNALRQSMLLYAKDKNVNLYWLRAYYILGDDIKNHSIFTKLIEASESGKKDFPFTSGKNMYDFITVDELAKQIAKASTQTKYTGIINVCSGIPTSLANRVENFISEKKLDIRLQYGAFKDRPYDSRIVFGDNKIISDIMKE